MNDVTYYMMPKRMNSFDLHFYLLVRIGSPGTDRTYDLTVNSRLLLPLSYWGIELLLAGMQGIEPWN